MKTLSKHLGAAAALLAVSASWAIADNSPEAFLVGGKPENWVGTLSNNGVWALGEISGDQEVDNPQSTGGTLLNVLTREITPIPAGTLGYASVGDVTDDGEIVVGSADGQPAFWTKSTNKWTKLSVGTGYQLGELLACTPDGKYAVGYWGSANDINIAYPCLYDLTTKQNIEMPGMPMIGLTGKNYNQNAASAISADGRYVFGMIGQGYLMDDGGAVMWAYIYDTADNTFRPIGYTVDESWNFTPTFEHTNFIDNIRVSPSGEWVTGAIRMAVPQAGSYFNIDNTYAFRYHVADGAMEIYDADADADCTGFSIDDNGVVYGAVPWENPYPSAMVRLGKYYYDYDIIFKQVYGFDLESAIADYITGKPVAISGDGLTQAMVNGSGLGYILCLKEPLTEGAAQVDLLCNYQASPASGSVMQSFKSMELAFDRAIDFNGDYAKIKVYDESGTEFLTALSSTQLLSSNNKVLSIGFRTKTMNKGETYTLVIPAGLISLKGDAEIKNREIKITYTGRGTGAVETETIYPADGASVSFLDAASNPIVIAYNASIKGVEDAPKAYLYEEGYDTPIAELISQVGTRNLYFYPSSITYLFSGVNYRVEVPAGIVTDLSGSGANEAISLAYKGMYVREVASDDTYIFRADGGVSAFLQMMIFDGDQNTPTTEMAGWTFTNNTGWIGVRDEDSTDYCFASHSMYNPAGKSDDWMMTPQLYIPDEKVYVSFDAQSYLNSKTDRLKVYLYANDEVLNVLHRETADDILANGTLIFDGQLSPGAHEGTITGEWENHLIQIPAEFAGKNVYVAFLNDNEDQSAVFVDNIAVMRDIDYIPAFKHATNVVNLNEIAIEGQLNITSSAHTFTSVALTLKDSKGNTIDTLTESGLSLTNGDVYPFSFSHALPLTVGEPNAFSIDVDLSGSVSVIKDVINDLVFLPTKRVVLEDNAGSTCANCPLGLLAIDRLKEQYPHNFIPITLRCYGGDFLGTAVQAYAEFLGMGPAAPIAMIDRTGNYYNPAVQLGDGSYRFTGQGITESDGTACVLWADAVKEKLDEGAIADIDFEVGYDEATRELTIPVSVRYALSQSDKSVKLFAAILEDQLLSYQDNNFFSEAHEELLPWSAGGSLGQKRVAYTFDDVCRGAIGQTYAGTGGLIPDNCTAGESYTTTLSGTLPAAIQNDKVSHTNVVVMLIDGQTNGVLNANICKVGESTTSAVDKVIDNAQAAAAITVRGNYAYASDPAAPMAAYSLDGRKIAAGVGIINLSGCKGVVIIRCADAALKTVIR